MDSSQQHTDSEDELQLLPSSPTDKDQAFYDIPLIIPEGFDSLGYGYHSLLRYFTCMECQTGVRPDHLLGHLSEMHSKKVKDEVIKQLITAYPPHSGVLPEIPTFPNNLPIIALPLLPIHEGLSWTLCNYHCLSTNTIKYHYSTQHRGQPHHSKHIKATLQIIYTQGNRQFFPVQQANNAISGITPYSIFLQSLPPVEKTAIIKEIGENEQASWMGRLGWFKQVEGHDAKELVTMAARHGLRRQVT